MINPKYITIAAVVGFCLSFFIGLVCGVGFGRILLRALIFAVVFAAISAGISVVYSIFLSSTSSSSDLDAAPTGTSGSVVNITVDDDVLPDDEYSPKFTVENNRRSLGAAALSDEKMTEKKSEQVSSNAESEAEPTPAEEPDVAEKPAEEAQPFKPANLGEMTKKTEPSSEDISDLPPIDDLSAESSADFESVDDVSSGSSSVGSSSSPVAVPDQNAQLMAQAISTILAKDEE